ncbi:MAG: iron ABC transporter substrate-binding protein [Oscillochloridaceae bacterium umkhey_bin13]
MRLRVLSMIIPLLAMILAACGSQPAAPAPAPDAPVSSGKLVIYSGRSETLVAPLFEQFTATTGIVVEARYGDTAELAATILEEGRNSPADLFFAQDAGALGALGAAEMLATLPEATLSQVEARFRSAQGNWVGVSGRARVVVYNTAVLSEADLPASITGFVAPEWQSRVGWAPTNGSFQSFVTAMRVQLGDEATRSWLSGMLANDAKVYERNSAIVKAVAEGEIDVGFVNHYYLYQLQQEAGGSLQAANYYPQDGDVGALINIAGVGILKTAPNAANAQSLLDYLLSDAGQRYFAERTFEYPLTDSVPADPRLRPLSEIKTPDLDLNELSDLQNTLRLLQDVGVL